MPKEHSSRAKASNYVLGANVLINCPFKMTAKKQETLVKEALQQKLKIKLRSYDHKVIDNCARQIVETVLRCGAQVAGPIPLPTEISKYTVNRSTFIHKDSREQFEIRIHKRIIIVLSPTPKVIDALANLNLPAGVDIEIKM